MRWTYDIDSLGNRDPALIARWARFVTATYARYHRATVSGLERIPAGPALYVGNHNAGAYSPDTLIFCAAAYHRYGIQAVPFGMAHEVLLRWPVIHQLLCPLGALRASHRNLDCALAAGHKVLVYPGGDLDAGRPFLRRHEIVFGGRRGYIRAALRNRVPIVPVVTAGAHGAVIIIDDLRWLARLLDLDRRVRLKVWPLTFSVPWGITIGFPPPFIPFPTRVQIEVLDPITFEPTGPDAATDECWIRRCAARVERAMQSALTRLAGRPVNTTAPAETAG